MELNDIFAVRLKNARQIKNMSMAALSSALDGKVSPQAIYKYESGKMLPSSGIISELAGILGVPMDYFFRAPKVHIEQIEFRKRYKLGAKERKSIEMIVTEKLERYVEISDICGEIIPEFRKYADIVSTKDDVLDVASQLRKKWNLGDERIPNVIQFLESLGIIVVETDGGENFDGFSGMADNIPVIALNMRYSAERKRFTALHELGHLVLNFTTDVSDTEEEKFCHIFAGEMLITIDRFRQIVGDLNHRRMCLHDFADVQRFYGISIDALIHKAYDFEMITESRYRNYNILKRTKPFFKNYAEETRFADEHTNRFDMLVYRAYTGELITGEKASQLLKIPLQNILENALIV